MGDVLGVILAGGRGTRLGRAKPVAPLGGRALLEHPLAALQGAELETVVVAKPDTPLPPVAAPVWSEPDEPVHPLLGIVTALERADGRAILACACDLPFVTPELVGWLAELDEPLVLPESGGRLHPLFGRYGVSLAAPLREALAAPRAAPGDASPRSAPGSSGRTSCAAFGDPGRLLSTSTRPPTSRARRNALAGAPPATSGEVWNTRSQTGDVTP